MRKLGHRDFPKAIQLTYEEAWKLPPGSVFLTVKPEVVGRIKYVAVNNETMALMNTSSFPQYLPQAPRHSVFSSGGISVSSQASAAFHKLREFTLRLATRSLISDWSSCFLSNFWLVSEQTSIQDERGKCKRAAGQVSWPVLAPSQEVVSTCRWTHPNRGNFVLLEMGEDWG